MSSRKYAVVQKKLITLLPYVICFFFFVAYSTLSIVRHSNYSSFGYDLGINDQVVWRYSTFQSPVSTIDPFPEKIKFYAHVELVYMLVAPFYWIWSSRKMLILVRTAWFCFSAIALYKLAREKGVNQWVSVALVVSYLGFYGVQNAMWADVHSSEFAAGFLMWLLYFMEAKKKVASYIFFFLAITARENIAFLTFLTSFVLFLKERAKIMLYFMGISLLYLFFIFFIFFPHILHVPYLYQNSGGIFSNLNPLSLVDSYENREVIWYTLLSFGFLPLLSPLYLLPVLGNLIVYFVFASELTGAQGLFGHYRISMVPFLAWAAIYAVVKYKNLNTWKTALYLIFFTLLVQYVLHLPLSYLSKDWFWNKPSAVNNINEVKQTYLPRNASVVAQNNIIPHISHRDKIYTLYPEKKKFASQSPCGRSECNWFRWHGHPEFLFVDISSAWDIRHLFANRDEYIDGLHNLEKAGIIKNYKQRGSTILYKVVRNPQEYK